MAASMGASIGLINSGSFRSDSLEPSGDITRETIDTILPFKDDAVLVDISGSELLAILENSVSQYPLLDGRFLQVSGVIFAFDPRKPPLERLQPGSVEVREDDGSFVPIDKTRTYRCAMKTYVFAGKDGYAEGNPDQILARSPGSIPSLILAHLAGNANSHGTDVVPEVSPEAEGRITCDCPDDDLLQKYEG